MVLRAGPRARAYTCRMTTRRELLRHAPLFPAGVLLGAAKQPREEEKVAPGEDLMREHGVLNRALLVYEAWMEAATPPADVLTGTAELIRRFVEEYHERIEEEELFPRFEKAGKLTALTRVLREQHRAGRLLTQQILTSHGDRAKASAPIRAFIRMYRPHEAREDTELFPAFQQLVGPKEYERLGEKFEDREHEMLGPEGFEKSVQRVAELENRIGIGDLAQFTPR
jgi:hemerythrin-like domain-containing protein